MCFIRKLKEKLKLKKKKLAENHIIRNKLRNEKEKKKLLTL